MSLVSALRAIEAVRAARSERLQPKTKVNHNSTKTTRQTNELADLARTKLTTLSQKITSALKDGQEFYNVKERHKKEVGTIIATSIRESYFLGFHFIEGFAKRSVKLNANHINKINDQINAAITSFWNNIRKEYEKALVDESLVSINSTVAGAAGFGDLFATVTNFVSNLAVSMNFQAVNEATVQTRQQVYVEDIGTVTGQVSVPQSIWVSERDGRVCPICTNLDGRTWPVTDELMPRPVQDSHFGCRCRLLPLDGERVYNG